MLNLLVIANPVTGVDLQLVPLFIAGGVLIAAVIFGLIMSQVAKKNKQKKKAQKKNDNKQN